VFAAVNFLLDFMMNNPSELVQNPSSKITVNTVFGCPWYFVEFVLKT